jgi:hypothetical protein
LLIGRPGLRLLCAGCPEPARDRSLATQDRPFATQDRPLAAQDRPLAAQERPFATQDRSLAAQDRPFAAQDRSLAAQAHLHTPRDCSHAAHSQNSSRKVTLGWVMSAHAKAPSWVSDTVPTAPPLPQTLAPTAGIV